VPETALSPKVIVTAALELLDEGGLHRFTMRALAQRLDTYPATIYWHVGNRGHVLSAVSDRVLDEAFATLPDPTTTPWDEWLRAFARTYRKAMQAHPAMATWGVTHFDAKVPASATLDAMVGVLTRAGFEGERLAGAYNAFIMSVVGWVGVELIADDPEVGSAPEELEQALHDLSSDEFPDLVANMPVLANQAMAFRWRGGITNPLDDGFEIALTTWIEGLRAQLEH
jgi:AcrR family transcriptional regulator